MHGHSRSAGRLLHPALVAFAGTPALILLGVAILNQAFNVGATSCFAASGHANRLRTFVIWQLVGGFFGLGVQLTFAGLVRYWSLMGANMIGTGLAFVSAQVFAAYMIFHESFHWQQWLGTALVFAGILLVSSHSR
jgi:drug/metabolite transporter (DMT)-like permease